MPKESQIGRWLAGCAAVFAVASVGWGVYRALTSSNDLLTRYKEWTALVGWGEQMGGWQVPYHPVTYLLLSPLFLPGFATARVLFLLLNLGCIVFIWHRLCRLVELTGWRRWLLLALFGCWANVRVTLGSGQFGLVFLAAVLGTYSWTPRRAAVGLSLGLVKHTLVFPLFLWLLLKRPRWVVAPAVVALVPVGALLLISQVSPAAFVSGSQQAALTMVRDWEGGTYVGAFFRPHCPSPVVLQAVIWSVWAGLFIGLLRFIRDEFLLLAGLLLMSLWPVYHRPYDLVVAAPALALFMRYLHPLWSAGLSVVMLGWYERLETLAASATAFRQGLFGLYYPLLIFGLLAVLVWLDSNRVPCRERLDGQTNVAP